MPLNCGEELVAGRLKNAFGGKRHMIIGRVANATKPLEGRAPCQYRNACWLGLPLWRLLQHTVLDSARGGEDREAHAEALVDCDRGASTTRIASAPPACGCLTPSTEQTTDYTAKVVFLCASTLNSTWLLMRSATDVWPDGLGSSSGELGHNLMDHHFRCGAEGNLTGLDDKYYYGRRPNGIYIPRYRNLFGDKRDYLRGFGYQGAASREGWTRAVKELGLGAEFKDEMTLPGPWKFGATGFGEMLPNHANRIGIDSAKKDKWGLPVLKIDCATGENERLMRKDMIADMAEMLEHAGAKMVKTFDAGSFPGMAIHEMGTARMGRDPKTSVLNSHNQVWDAPNVFVTDGSCMVSSACQNPSLTYMALTARAVDFAVNELNRRNL